MTILVTLLSGGSRSSAIVEMGGLLSKSRKFGSIVSVPPTIHSPTQVSAQIYRSCVQLVPASPRALREVCSAVSDPPRFVSFSL